MPSRHESMSTISTENLNPLNIPQSSNGIKKFANNHTVTNDKLVAIIIVLFVVAVMQLFLGNNVDAYLRSLEEQSRNSLRQFRAGEDGRDTVEPDHTSQAWIPTNMTNDEPHEEAAIPPTKNPIGTVFLKAGIKLTPQILEQIPPYSHVQNMYGEEPVILGLERCKAFQQQVKPEDRLTGPSGMFNTGTHLMHKLLVKNCQNTDRMLKYGRQNAGVRFQAPWGKHSPESYRLRHWEPLSKGTDQSHFLPVVMTKDPYFWMQSICRHAYTARWNRTDAHCPNLVPNEVDKKHGFVQDEEHEARLKKEGIPVTISYNPNTTEYTNLAGAWNTWYGAHFDADYPRLFVRFEDLLLHTETVVTQVCRCFGGKVIDETNFKFTSASAKGAAGEHEGSAGLTEALLRYTNADKRVKSFTSEDLVFANDYLNRTLMAMLHYASITLL